MSLCLAVASTYKPAATMGAAIRAEDSARKPVVREPAMPAAISKESLSNPAAIQPRYSWPADERNAAAVPTPIARSRMPTVRSSSGIDVPATAGSQRRNISGEALNATPAASLTAAIPAPTVLARYAIRTP